MKAVIEIVKNIKNSKNYACKNVWKNAGKNACKNVVENAGRNVEKNAIKKAGFTLMELLVVLAIFALIMGIALFNQSSLTSSVLVTNLAYETALAVREAQTYGISVKASGVSASSFDIGYGAYFDIDNPLQIIVFTDSNANKNYDIGEMQSLYEIKNQRGNKIKSICVFKDGLPGCTPVGGGQKLSIMFKRPNPESSFYVANSTGGIETAIGPAEIVVGSSEDSSCRMVVVEVTGQIRVDQMASCSSQP